jgi:hypothetical protein
MNELKDDVREFYLWAEKQESPTVAYGVRYYLFELERAIDNLNNHIQNHIK